MNQKEYELLAKVIKDRLHEFAKIYGLGQATTAILNLALNLTVELEKEYSSFDRKKFLNACDITEETAELYTLKD